MSFYSDFAEHYEKIFPFRVPTYEFLRRHLPAAGHILDVGCGTGHYCGRLAADGFTVTGIDLDEKMIARARETYDVPQFEIRNMLELVDDKNRFAAAFCIGNVAAHVPASAMSEFLAAVEQHLEPGGIWIVQTVNFDPILAHESHTFGPLSLAGSEVTFHREYRDITPERLRFCTRLEAGGRELFAGEVDLNPVRSEIFIQAHIAAGFSLIGHWADFKETPFASERNSGSIYVFQGRE